MTDTHAHPNWQRAFRNVIDLYGGVRATARLLGISPSTASRLGRGDAPDPSTAALIGPQVGMCPCCGQTWPTPPTGGSNG